MDTSQKDAAAKAKGAVLKIEVDGKTGYFKTPNRYAQGLFLSKLSINQVEALEILLKNSILKEFSNLDLDDDSDFFACTVHAAKLIELIEKKSATSTIL